MKKIIIISILIFTTVLFYQNCGEVNLQNKTEPSTPQRRESHFVSMKFCIENTDGTNWDLHSLPVIVNLNAIPNGNSFLADSDMDGLPDIAETSPYLPNNPRSIGALDFICETAGQCNTPDLGQDFLLFGLTLQDLNLYTNIVGNFDINNPPEDTDYDGLPDFIEIIRKGDPSRSEIDIPEADDDQDNDGRSISQEIRDQTDPFVHSTANATKFRPIRKQTILVDEECPNNSKSVIVEVPDQPFVPVAAYPSNPTDPVKELTLPNGQKINLRHEENENIIVTYVITSSQTINNNDEQGISFKGFLHIGRIRDVNFSNPGEDIIQSLELNFSDFVFLREWEK